VTSRHLEGGETPDVETTQQCECAIAEGELRLPDWQEHVDEIGEAIVERVRGASAGETTDRRGGCSEVRGEL
jgi:hypothetical protein